jgi:S-(hydroxymethyl)glutathione dehydrogenase/alcohol dehydrogenase
LGTHTFNVCLSGWKCKDDYPKLVDEYMAGKIKVDEFITAHMPIEKINDALNLLLHPTGKR